MNLSRWEQVFLIMAVVHTALAWRGMPRGERLGFTLFLGALAFGGFLVYRGIGSLL